VSVDLPFGETFVGLAVNVAEGLAAAQILPFHEVPDVQIPVGNTLARTVAPSRAWTVFIPNVIGYETGQKSPQVAWFEYSIDLVALKRSGVVAPVMFQVNGTVQVLAPSPMIQFAAPRERVAVAPPEVTTTVAEDGEPEPLLLEQARLYVYVLTVVSTP